MDQPKKARLIYTRMCNGEYPIQRESNWYSRRYNILTASEISSCLGHDIYQSSYNLLVKKIKPLEPEQNNIAIEWGNRYESIAIKFYEFMKSEPVHSIGLVDHKKHKFLGASPDGLLLSGRLLEIKCPISRQITDVVPLNYWIQVQIQLEVCDLEECDFLECKFYEYKTKEEYDNDILDVHKGVTDNIYWKLIECSMKIIKRDSSWFEQNITKIENFYNLIVYYRKYGLLKLSKDMCDKSYKRQKIISNIVDWSKWVSASNLRNYTIGDPIIDWLEYHSHTNTQILNMKIKPSSFNSYLLKNGVTFENKIISELRTKFTRNFVDLNTSNCTSIEMYNATLAHIRNKIPIIYHGVLHDYDKKIFGIPDLLVRIDWINKIFNQRITSRPTRGLYYVIVDIKNTSLTLCSDGLHLRNSNGNISYCKSQVYMYTKILGVMQKFTPTRGYIMGKQISYTKDGIYHTYSTFDKPATINFKTHDKLIRCKTASAITWVRRMRNGKDWSILNPGISEMRPNMCVRSDKWDSVKKYIVSHTNDITQLWMCGSQNRNYAISNNITNWRTHLNLLASNLDIHGEKTSKTLQLIINYNQTHNSHNVIYPEKILSNIFKWRSIELEFYIDFETITDAIISPELSTFHGVLIFMIGVGYYDDKWNYTCFIADSITIESERNIIIAVHKHIADITTQISKSTTPKLWHWGHAERSTYNNIMNRHIDYVDSILTNWCDLLTLFKTEPIIIRGSLNFSLKSMVAAFYAHKFIKTNYIDSEINNGLNAMVYAYEEYVRINNSGSINNSDIMKNIKNYNEIDCKTLYEILDYLRSTH